MNQSQIATMKTRLMVVIASTRPGRVGLPVGNWFAERVEADPDFELDLVDLAELDLPFLDEPNHPRLGRYEHLHTQEWAARVARADAFAMITPEYNYGFSAPLKNAIDYLNVEWAYKPVGFVSYGGVSAGLRAVQMLKQVVTTLRMQPVFEGVAIPFVSEFIDDEGLFAPNPLIDEAATAMLAELRRVEVALKVLRPEAREASASAAGRPRVTVRSGDNEI